MTLNKKTRILILFYVLAMVFISLVTGSYAQKYQNVYRTESMKPVDSVLKVQEGDQAPLFTLRSVNHGMISLEQYRGKKNVVLSFVPAAWTPICSDQWPGYNIVEDIFEQHDSVLLGISVDNIPTLHAWMKTIGNLWFPVLSDFWPHGEVAEQYGVLRSDGLSERAIFIIDKQGIIRYIDVHDVNVRPELEALVNALKKISTR